MVDKIVGRKKEISELNECLNSNKSEFVALYGRRRVGKTYLIKNAINDQIDFSFTGLYKTNLKIQLDYFCNELQEKTRLKITRPKNWMEAFTILKNYLLTLKSDKVVVFLDELPWMDTQKSNFRAAISYFWNTWDSEKTILKLVVCGSSTTYMINKLIGDKGGLYGRVTKSIYLPPFNLKETKEFLNNYKGGQYSNLQITNLYMIFGGIPYYLDMINVDVPISTNIDRLFFEKNGQLRNELDFIFKSLFNESENYKKIILSLAKKQSGLSRDEIIDQTKINGGVLTEMLSNLSLCNFISSYSKFNNKKKEKIYMLVDNFSCFYLKFVDLTSGQDDKFWTNSYNKPTVNSWYGHAFEIVCLNNVNEIKNALGISGILSNVCFWKKMAHTDENGISWPGGQIDLIIDRDDNTINVCEIKYSNEEYIITKEYERVVMERNQNFKNDIKTKKSIICTFITTYGVKKNLYSSIVNKEVVIDDLFY